MRNSFGFILMTTLMLTLVVTQKSQAATTDVRDREHIAQTLINYAELVRIYGELVRQSGFSQEQNELIKDQNLQMVRDYQQVMKEYEQYLIQIKALRDSIPAEEWASLGGRIKLALAGVSDITGIQKLPTSNRAILLDRLRGVHDGQDLAPTQPALASIYYRDNLNIPESDSAGLQENANALELQYLRYAAQHESVARNEKAINDFDEKIAQAKVSLNRLDTATDLATLQMIAQLQLMQLEQQTIQLKQADQHLLYYEPMSVLVTQQKTASAKREKARQTRNLRRNNSGEDYNSFAEEFEL